MDRASVCRAMIGLLLGFSYFACSPHIAAQDMTEPRESDAHIEQSIASKLAEIETLKNEVEQMREQLASEQQLEIALNVYEVNLTKMRRLGVDISKLENGKPVTRPIMKISDLGEHAGTLLEALAKENIAKLALRHEKKVLSGERFTINGNKLPYPQLSRSPELEIYDISTAVSAKQLKNGLLRVQVFLKLASLDFSRVQQLEGKEVPEISEFAFDYGFECNENQECIVQSLPELRTMVIRTESGDQEVKEEFQNFVVVRVKKIDETAPQNAVQPVSAVTPVGQAF